MLTYKLPHQGVPVPIEDIKAMLKCMHKYMALGLAANQVGYPLRIITVDPHLVMIDPQVISVKGDPVTAYEVCLSLPGVTRAVTRIVEEITVTYKDAEYTLCETKFSAMTARVIQHEIDHLNGILITERGDEWKV